MSCLHVAHACNSSPQCQPQLARSDPLSLTPPDPCRQQVLLVDLPHAALYAILHRAGPRSRELCRALLDVYGPLPRLTPRGIETPADLMSALVASGRHSRLSELDLSHVSSAVINDTLLALCTALPNLRAVRLPGPYQGCKLSAASVAAATVQLVSLTALHLPSTMDWDTGPAAEWPFTEACAHLRELTLPSPPPMAHSSAAVSHFTALSKLCVASVARMGAFQFAALAAQLPALVALEMGVCVEVAAQLHRLTRLTALKLSGQVSHREAGEGATTGQLLQHDGTVTSLRSLGPQLLWQDEDTAQPGWLNGLVHLTSLRIDFRSVGLRWIDELLAFDHVASSVPHLPALSELHMCDINDCSGHLSASACAHIASARSSLKSLALRGLSLPHTAFTAVLPQLTALTCLRLHYGVYRPPIELLSWLTTLTGLSELWSDGDSGGAQMLPCQLLAHLSNVHTLSLTGWSFVDRRYLEQLCVAMPQLRSLDLSDTSNMGDALAALQHFTNLEVLGLESAEDDLEALRHIRPPWSLQRCCLGEFCSRKTRADAVAVLGRQVEAAFSQWHPELYYGW
jgi:hypothetical protein